MKCVGCKQPMIVLELDQIEVDYCLDCGGTWLDAGELGLLLDSPQDVEQILKLPAKTGSSSGKGRKCPICLKRMDEFTVGSGDPIHIDRCRKGHGIWFDRGELKEVVETLGGVANNKVADLLQDIFGEKKKLK